MNEQHKNITAVEAVRRELEADMDAHMDAQGRLANGPEPFEANLLALPEADSSFSRLRKKHRETVRELQRVRGLLAVRTRQLNARDMKIAALKSRIASESKC